jgi:hypothetical protein
VPLAGQVGHLQTDERLTVCTVGTPLRCVQLCTTVYSCVQACTGVYSCAQACAAGAMLSTAASLISRTCVRSIFTSKNRDISAVLASWSSENLCRMAVEDSSSRRRLGSASRRRSRGADSFVDSCVLDAFSVLSRRLPTCRGTWARVTIDHFRHLSFQNCMGHRASTNLVNVAG